jgi:Protein of unknown function (DUF2865)
MAPIFRMMRVSFRMSRLRGGRSVAGVIKRHSRALEMRAVVIVGAFAVANMTVLDSACAEGFFDFLFGGFQRPAPPVEPNAHPPPPAGVGRVAPAPLGQESVTEGGGSTGHTVAFCVRLCDGQHYPLEQLVNGTPAETCRTSCPHSRTKVYFGSELAAPSPRTASTIPISTPRSYTAGN